jgi:hypothetical protein
MKEAGIGDRLLALLLLGLFAFSPPLLSMFSLPGLIFGIPALFLYLFGTWAVLILLLAAVSRRTTDERDGTGDTLG